MSLILKHEPIHRTTETLTNEIFTQTHGNTLFTLLRTDTWHLHFDSFIDSILEFNVAQEFKQRSNLNYFAVEVSDDTVRRKTGK